MLYENEKPEVHLDTVDKVGTIYCFVLLRNICKNNLVISIVVSQNLTIFKIVLTKVDFQIDKTGY